MTLFNTGRNQPFLRMFGRRRNNRNGLWLSLLGLGIGAATFGLSRFQNGKMRRPVQNLMQQFRQNTQNANPMPNKTAFAEFAQEIAPNKQNSNEMAPNQQKNQTNNSK